MTKSTSLTATVWADLGPTPLRLQLVSVFPALYVVDTVAPTLLNADAHVLSNDGASEETISVAGQHVYARALNLTAIVVTSDAPAEAAGAKADAAATNTTGSWSVIALLKASLAALLGPTPAGTNNIGIVGIQDALRPNGSTGYSLSAVGVFGTGWLMDGYASIAWTITAVGVGATYILEGSDDSTNGIDGTWFGCRSHNPNGRNGEANTQVIDTLGGFWGNVPYKWGRVRLTTYTSGTFTIVPILRFITAPTFSLCETFSNNQGGIALTSRLLSSAATTNAALVKSSAGRIYKVYGYNASASVRYLKLYNRTSAPTVGTDMPVITRAIPIGTFSIDWADIGYYFAAGIAYAITGAVADNDTTAIGAGDIVAFGVDYA